MTTTGMVGDGMFVLLGTMFAEAFALFSVIIVVQPIKAIAHAIISRI